MKRKVQTVAQKRNKDMREGGRRIGRREISIEKFIMELN